MGSTFCKSVGSGFESRGVYQIKAGYPVGELYLWMGRIPAASPRETITRRGRIGHESSCIASS